MEKAHALAKRCDKRLPYLGMYITQLVTGQGLNQHRDYRNHEKYLNYTINFGKCEGGDLEMLRGEEWQSCAVPLVWTEFMAGIVEHRAPQELHLPASFFLIHSIFSVHLFRICCDHVKGFLPTGRLLL